MPISWMAAAGAVVLIVLIVALCARTLLRVQRAKSDLGPLSAAWVAEHRDALGYDAGN